MSGTITAIVVGAGAVLGAGASIYGANKAASATQDASNAALGFNRQALAQQQANSQPYLDVGKSAIPTYQALTSANPAQVEKTLQGTPGYAATYGQGVEGAERAAAASGLNLSGNQVAGVESFGAQLGDSTYQQAINNALGGVEIGQAAAAGSSANIGNASNNASNIVMNQGTNQANITSNEVAGLSRLAGQTGNQFLTYNALKGLNNPGGAPYSYDPGSGTPGGSFATMPNYDPYGAGGAVPPDTTYLPPP